MKTNVTYVDASLFETIILESGLPFTPQKGFIRIDGPRGRRLYVASTKRVGRVDISGFTVSLGAVSPHCGEFGNVKQQLDMSLPQDEILENFRWILVTMAGLPAAEKAERKPASPKADEPTGWTKIDPRARLQKLKAKGEAKKGGKEERA